MSDSIQQATAEVLDLFKEARRLADAHPDGFELELLFDMAKYCRDRRSPDDN